MASDRVAGKLVNYVCPNGPDHDGPCYIQKEFTCSNSNPYERAGGGASRPMVIIGLDMSFNAQATVRVFGFKRGASNTVDSCQARVVTQIVGTGSPTQVSGGLQSGTGPDAIGSIQCLPRRMYVPPEGKIDTDGSTPVTGQLVECATVNDAMRIL